MSDIRDILDIEQPNAEISKDSIIHGDRLKRKYVTAKAAKRPEGMHREVFALLYNDNKELPPLMPTDTGNGYKEKKAKLGMRRVRKWVWAPFTNPARKDNAVFYHWKRATDEAKEYPFAQFNKQVAIPSYSESEYSQYLKSEDWSQAETEHLMDLCARFDLRFIVVHDRWDRDAFRDRSVEDLKERYYHISAVLSKLKSNPWSEAVAAGGAGAGGGGGGGERRVYQYDAEHERRRKEQLLRLFERTQAQIDEEQALLAELKRIEARRRERERKTADLQRLISRAELPAPAPAATAAPARRLDRKLHRKRPPPPPGPPRAADAVVEWSGIRFPEARGAGVWLRSQRMKLPPGVGQRKVKAIDSELKLMHIEPAPTPTEDTCRHFNELRSELALAADLRTALASLEFELQALRHQYEALAPGKTLTVPAALQGADDARPADIIDVVGSPTMPN